MNSVFLSALIGSLSRNILGHSRFALAAHGSDNMASRFLESLNEAQIPDLNKKAIPINNKKVTKFGLGNFQDKVSF